MQGREGMTIFGFEVTIYGVEMTGFDSTMPTMNRR